MTDVKSFMLSLKPEDITKDFFDDHFAVRYDPKNKKVIKPEIDLQYEFILKKGEYCNTEDVKTNAGQLLVNKVLYERTPRIQAVVGYINKPFDKDVVKAAESQMAQATLSDKITTDDWATYLNCIQWLDKLDHFKIL